MLAIASIRRFRIPLCIALACFVALLLAELVHLHAIFDRGATFEADRVTSALMFLPALGATFCFFPLCYLAWFCNPTRSAFARVKKVFFWILACAGGLVWYFVLSSLAS